VSNKTEAGPVAEWMQSPVGNYPMLVWHSSYIAEVGAKLYAHPPAQEQQSAISPKDCVWARNGHQVCPSAAPAQEHPNLACKSVQKRLATQWGYVPAQEQPAPGGMPNGYEAMTTCYKRYVSPAQYAAFSPGVQKWYRPFWTATHPTPAERAEQPPRDAVQQGLPDEQIDALWRQAASADGFTTAQFVREFARAIERATLKGQP
jgi:hypothetical protein